MDRKTPGFAEIVRMRVVYAVAGMDAVAVRRHVVYKTVGDEQLHMAVYSPPGPAQSRPAVVLVHGGPIPRRGAKNMGIFTSYGELLAASGFVAVTFDHRFLGPDRIADAAQDVDDVIAGVRRDAASLGVDPDRMSIWAFSGGGAFLARPLSERRTWLRAVVAYYAILDSAIDALGHEARGVPPIFVARAGRDNERLNGDLDRFVHQAQKSGATLDLLNHPEGRHSFDILDDDERSRQVIARTIGFLRDALSP